MRTRRSLRAATAACSLASLLLLGACAPEDPGPPYRALVYEHVSVQEGYALIDVELSSLRALRGLDGELTTVLGGVDVALNPLATIESEEDMAGAFRVRRERPVHVRWFLRDGVMVAEDFGSLLLFSYYRHFERCHELFQRHGVPESLPGHIPTFHLPTFGTLLVGGLTLISDNAGFSPAFGAFALFPRHMLMDRLPLAMNLGVVCHEYSHAVFHSLVVGDSMMPAGWGWPRPAENLMRSLDEGFADLFGALVTSDHSFMEDSVPERWAVERDLSRPHRYDAEMARRLAQEVLYDPYPLGTVIASALWKVGEQIGPEALADSTVNAMKRLGEVAGPGLDLEAVSDIIHETMVEGGRASLCDELSAAGLPQAAACGES